MLIFYFYNSIKNILNFTNIKKFFCNNVNLYKSYHFYMNLYYINRIPDNYNKGHIYYDKNLPLSFQTYFKSDRHKTL
jgi:hypothetical protein